MKTTTVLLLLAAAAVAVNAQITFARPSATVAIGDDLRLIEKRVLDTILNGYDARIRPNGVNGSNQMDIAVNLFVRSVGQFDAQHNALSLQLSMTQHYQDARLAYKSITTRLPHVNIRDIKVRVC